MSMKHNALRANIRVIVLITTLLIMLIAWAGYSRISQTARAQGQVIAVARTQVIQAAIDGVIASFNVQEGQVVKKGQILVRLDDQQVAASLAESKGKIAALKAALVRLRAEVLGYPLTFPEALKDWPQFVEVQTELFHRRQVALNEDLEAMGKSLALANKELALNRPLVATGDVGEAEIIRLERQSVDISGQMTARRNRYFQDAQTEMAKVEEDLASQEKIEQDRVAVYERANILAPADGVVKNIQISTPGARVRPGDIIMELVPSEGGYVMEVKLKPADIAKVRTGLPAQLKLDAYDYSMYGTLLGEVSYVSPDALTERTPQGEIAYYRVHISVDKEYLNKHNHMRPDKTITIQPGLTGSVDIEIGKNTILSYLTKPVSKTLHEAMNER